MKKNVMLSFIVLILAISVTACVERVPLLTDIEYSYDATDKVFLVTASRDLKDIAIEYITYDSTGIVTGTYTKRIGNLKAGKTYKVDTSIAYVWSPWASAEIVGIKAGD